MRDGLSPGCENTARALEVLSGQQACSSRSGERSWGSYCIPRGALKLPSSALTPHSASFADTSKPMDL